jgi:hypothetical protein
MYLFIYSFAVYLLKLTVFRSISGEIIQLKCEIKFKKMFNVRYGYAIEKKIQAGCIHSTVTSPIKRDKTIPKICRE